MATMSYLVRVATPDDTEAVGAVLAASYPALLASHYDKDLLARVLPMITRANPRLLASNTFYVAQTPQGEIVGCGGWTPEHPGTGEVVKGAAHIRHFATHPGWIRRGLGSAIIARCRKDAAARGVVKLHCYATLAAENFYRAAGFTTVASADVLMGSSLPFPTRIMQLEL